MTIVEQEMSSKELLESIYRELEGYKKREWKSERIDTTFDRIKLFALKFAEENKPKIRKEAAADIFSLAHEYAQNDKTMLGSEELRSYHYFNAISKIGEFPGR